MDSSLDLDIAHHPFLADRTLDKHFEVYRMLVPRGRHGELGFAFGTLEEPVAEVVTMGVGQASRYNSDKY